MQKTIYFADRELWDRLGELADKDGLSVSAYIVEAVRAYTMRKEVGCPRCEAIREMLQTRGTK